MGLCDTVKSCIQEQRHLLRPMAIFAGANLMDLGLTYYGLHHKLPEVNSLAPAYLVQHFGPDSLIYLKTVGFAMLIPLIARADSIAKRKNYAIHGQGMINAATMYTLIADISNLAVIATHNHYF